MSAPRLSADEDARRRAAYEQFDTDATAAEALGIEKITFKQWRRRVGLPAHPRFYTPDEKATILALFRQLGGRWPHHKVVQGWSR